MTMWFALSCAVVCALLTCMNYAVLWRLRRHEQRPRGWLSPFSFAAQGAFAAFAALLLASDALDSFTASDGIVYGELFFMVLMFLGFFSDWKRWRASRA